MASYIQLLTHHPVPGKGPELRAVLEEWVKAAPSRGFEHNLQRQLGADGPVFINGIRHENLTAFHTYPERSRANPGWESFTKKMGSLMARPRHSELFQSLVPPSREAPRPNFHFRITRYPAAGKWLELQALLEERAKAAQGSGFRMLSRRMFGREGISFVTSIGFQDLDSLETFMAKNDQDAQFRAYVEKVESLTARPSRTELFQVLVPFRRR